MRVRARLFAGLDRYVPAAAPGTALEIDLPDDATIAHLMTALKLPPEQVRLTFVNGSARTQDWRLEPNDEIGIFPPIGGG